MASITRATELLGIQFTQPQLDTFRYVGFNQKTDWRACLFFKTGAGKTITSLVSVFLWDYTDALVIAPPSTHSQWVEQAEKLGIKVTTVSHAKFRQKDFKVDRFVPIIADEFHLFGGHTGAGWKKLDRLARGLKAPLIMASATPNYNDAERVYCVQHILDPVGTSGGYLEFLYKNCATKQNPFGMIPEVTGFLNHATAIDYLVSLRGVYYVADDLVYQIEPVTVSRGQYASIETYGYNAREHKMIASIIEEKHACAYQDVVFATGGLRQDVYSRLRQHLISSTTPVLIFCNHSKIAEVVASELEGLKTPDSIALVTGKTSAKNKADIIRRFNDGEIDFLVGTASLATGTDGMDKVCDRLIIIDDTEDDALRRQLIGRIMPRGLTPTAGHSKRVFRFEFS